MFALKGRRDGFRFLFPKDYLVDVIQEKYSSILRDQKSFYTEPIDFVNETIKSINVLGFSDATSLQQQHGIGNSLDPNPTIDQIRRNALLHTGADVAYRSEKSPLALIDKTFTVTFRHTLGFLNYFILFENFWHLYSRDLTEADASNQFIIDIIDSCGRVYSRIVLYDPIIHGIDMLALDYSQPVAQSDTFTITFKYTNIDYQFISVNDELIV